MSYEEFEVLYRPIKNNINIDAAFDGYLFETYGSELQFVISQNPDNIFTICSGDYDDLYLTPGFHLVNRLGYIITEVSYNDTIKFEEILLEDEYSPLVLLEKLHKFGIQIPIKINEDKLTKNKFLYLISDLVDENTLNTIEDILSF